MNQTEIKHLVEAGLEEDTMRTVQYMSEHVFGLITKPELLFKIANLLWSVQGLPTGRKFDRLVLMAKAFDEYREHNQRVRCNHDRWGTTTHCAHMACPNYVGRCDWLAHTTEEGVQV